jgi:hypothetical protein
VIGDLRSLAELLGWEYKPKHSIRIGNTVKTISVIAVPLQEFKGFLAGWEEAEGRPPGKTTLAHPSTGPFLHSFLQCKNEFLQSSEA